MTRRCKLFFFFLLMIMTMALCSCAGKKNPRVSIPNPVVKVSDSSAFAALELSLDVPTEAKDVEYSILAETVAQVRFSLEDDRVYIFRAAHTQEDISGVYATFDQEELGIDADTEGWSASIRVRTIDGGTSGALADWYSKETNTQYSLYTGRSVDREDFAALALKLAEHVLVTE